MAAVYRNTSHGGWGMSPLNHAIINAAKSRAAAAAAVRTSFLDGVGSPGGVPTGAAARPLFSCDVIAARRQSERISPDL
ncbi:hypothetical protein ARTHROSP310_03070 [Arthrobacter sp. AD-310]